MLNQVRISCFNQTKNWTCYVIVIDILVQNLIMLLYKGLSLQILWQQDYAAAPLSIIKMVLWWKQY